MIHPPLQPVHQSNRTVLKLYLLILLLLISGVHTVYAQDTGSPYRLLPVEIMVTGHQPGPRLWKISYNDNVLWIFAFLSPLPDGMIWESGRVEEILAQSQEYLPLPRINTNTSFPREFWEIPDRQKLNNILPPQLYKQYRELKKEYFRFNLEIEKRRPMFAAATFVSLTFKKNNLSSGNDVLREIENLARQNPNLTRTEFIKDIPKELHDDFQSAYLSGLSKITHEQEIECFNLSLKQIKPEIDFLRQQANAWASGDIGELRYLNDVKLNKDNPCQFLIGAEKYEKLLSEYISSGWDEWLGIVENALQHNRSSFAVLSLDDLLNEGFILKVFRDKGYIIQEPM